MGMGMEKDEFVELLLQVMEGKSHWAWPLFTSGQVARERLHVHFEQEYETYVRDFPVLVARAYVQCPVAEVRRELAENIYEEETGGLIAGRPHPELFLEYARGRTLPDNASRCDYRRANLFELPKLYESGAFNITTLMQTLLLFGPDEYPEVLRSLMQVTRDWIFLSSLFTDKRMDVTAQIRDYVRFGEDSQEHISYNTSCMDRFRRVATQLGAKEVIFRDFEISMDLTGYFTYRHHTHIRADTAKTGP